MRRTSIPRPVRVLSYARSSWWCGLASLLAAAFVMGGGATSALAQTPQATSLPSPPVELQPGDSVAVTVWRRPELSGGFRIGEDGTPLHPLYRSVKVTGVPLSEVEQRLRTLLLQYETDPQMVVEALFHVAVTGEVREPNLYMMPPGSTVSQAIARAGGVTENGSLGRISLIRDGHSFKVSVMGETSAAATQVRSGDQIMVGGKPHVFRDIVLPVASLAAALASVVNLVRH
jgi:polysaccharide biosynthesis/export protein